MMQAKALIEALGAESRLYQRRPLRRVVPILKSWTYFLHMKRVSPKHDIRVSMNAGLEIIGVTTVPKAIKTRGKSS